MTLCFGNVLALVGMLPNKNRDLKCLTNNQLATVRSHSFEAHLFSMEAKDISWRGFILGLQWGESVHIKRNKFVDYKRVYSHGWSWVSWTWSVNSRTS